VVTTGPSADRMVRSGAVAVAVVLAAVALASTVAQSTMRGVPARTTVRVDEFDCGANWSAPQSGQRQISVVNAGSSVVDVELLGVANALTYGEIEAVAPGLTRTITAVIPPGRYRLGCVYSENATVYSPTEVVSGHPIGGGRPYLQVTYDQMAPLVASYRAAVTAGLSTLATDTDHLRTLADAGQLAQAEQAWLVAHLDYARLGAAYDTFADFNDEIDGRPNGLPQGVDDPNWTGFLRLEYALWHNQPPATVAAVADELDAYVHQLVTAFPEQSTAPNDLSLRTHEILENTLQFELTGETDQGSHTGLATSEANVQGTEMTLAAITPLLRRNDPTVLATASGSLHRLGQQLDTYQHPDGSWTPVQSLTQAQREHLDGAIGGYLETISPVPDLLELKPEASSP
jgi:high-affinity iron transporter